LSGPPRARRPLLTTALDVQMEHSPTNMNGLPIMRRWPLLFGLVPALVACLSLGSRTANPTYRVFWNTPLNFLRPWFVSIIGSAILFGALLLSASTP
jgi:hypothetical protein